MKKIDVMNYLIGLYKHLREIYINMIFKKKLKTDDYTIFKKNYLENKYKKNGYNFKINHLIKPFFKDFLIEKYKNKKKIKK